MWKLTLQDINTTWIEPKTRKSTVLKSFNLVVLKFFNQVGYRKNYPGCLLNASNTNIKVKSDV